MTHLPFSLMNKLNKTESAVFIISKGFPYQITYITLPMLFVIFSSSFQNKSERYNAPRCVKIHEN